MRNITVQNVGLNSVTLHKNFNPIIYIPVMKNEVKQIRIYITQPNTKLATFITTVTRCTLHFRRVHK